MNVSKLFRIWLFVTAVSQALLAHVKCTKSDEQFMFMVHFSIICYVVNASSKVFQHILAIDITSTCFGFGV